MKSTITQSWAHFITELKYEDLTPEAVSAAKTSILDTLGALLAGTSSPTGSKIARLVQDWGGAPESSIWPGRMKVPAANAALVNAVSARARELDDALEMLPFHASTIMIPAGLALAEKRGGLSGRDFITAIVSGVEIAGRMGLASKTTGLNRVPNARSIWGTLGAAAVAAKISEFNEKELSNAWGIALRLGGGCEQVGGSTADETLWVGCGIDAMHGILACLLTGQGVAGPINSVEEFYGRFEGGEYKEEEVFGGMGERFVITKTSLKAWPTCRMSHGAIEGTLDLIQKYNILPEDVDEIIVHLNKLAFERACLPLEQKRAPGSIADALFSIPFAIGIATVCRRVGMSDFTQNNLKDQRILDISAKVRPQLNQAIKHPVGRPPAIVVIRTKNGQEFIRQVEYIKGNPKNPLTWSELKSKFKDCALWAAPPLSQTQADDIIRFVENLEEREDICNLFPLIFNLNPWH